MTIATISSLCSEIYRLKFQWNSILQVSKEGKRLNTPKHQIQSTWVKVVPLGLGQESTVGFSVRSPFSWSPPNKAQVSGCRRISVPARQHSWRGWRHPEGKCTPWDVWYWEMMGKNTEKHRLVRNKTLPKKTKQKHVATLKETASLYASYKTKTTWLSTSLVILKQWLTTINHEKYHEFCQASGMLLKSPWNGKSSLWNKVEPQQYSQETPGDDDCEWNWRKESPKMIEE